MHTIHSVQFSMAHFGYCQLKKTASQERGPKIQGTHDDQRRTADTARKHLHCQRKNDS